MNVSVIDSAGNTIQRVNPAIARRLLDDKAVSWVSRDPPVLRLADDTFVPFVFGKARGLNMEFEPVNLNKYFKEEQDCWIQNMTNGLVVMQFGKPPDHTRVEVPPLGGFFNLSAKVPDWAELKSSKDFRTLLTRRSPRDPNAPPPLRIVSEEEREYQHEQLAQQRGTDAFTVEQQERDAAEAAVPDARDAIGGIVPFTKIKQLDKLRARDGQPQDNGDLPPALAREIALQHNARTGRNPLQAGHSAPAPAQHGSAAVASASGAPGSGRLSTIDQVRRPANTIGDVSFDIVRLIKAASKEGADIPGAMPRSRASEILPKLEKLLEFGKLSIADLKALIEAPDMYASVKTWCVQKLQEMLTPASAGSAEPDLDDDLAAATQ